MPKISDYPRLKIQFIGSFLEITNVPFAELPKVVGYVHLDKMDVSTMTSFIEEFAYQIRQKVREQEQEKASKPSSDQSNQNNPSD